MASDALLLQQHGRDVEIVDAPVTRLLFDDSLRVDHTWRPRSSPSVTDPSARHDRRDARRNQGKWSIVSIDPGGAGVETLTPERRAAGGQATSRRVRGPRPRSSSLVAVGVVYRVAARPSTACPTTKVHAMAARMPLDRLFDYLRTQAHPPFDYLLRAPFRAPAASARRCGCRRSLCSVGTLVLFAWWMRARGIAAVVAHGGARLQHVPVFHGGEARMYALLQSARCRGRPCLAGAVAEAITPPAGAPWAAGGLVRAGAVRPRLRRVPRRAGDARGSRDCAPTGGRGSGTPGWWARVGLWAVAWGTSFAHQAGGDWVGLIPRTSPTAFARAVSGQVTDIEPTRLARARGGARRRVVSRPRTVARAPVDRGRRGPFLRPRPSGSCHRSYRSCVDGGVLGAAAGARLDRGRARRPVVACGARRSRWHWSIWWCDRDGVAPRRQALRRRPRDRPPRRGRPSRRRRSSPILAVRHASGLPYRGRAVAETTDWVATPGMVGASGVPGR